MTSSLPKFALCLAAWCQIAGHSAGQPDANVNSPASAQPTSDRITRLPSDPRHALWIPGDYQHAGHGLDVLVDFHSGLSHVGASARQAGLNCVVISVQYAGLSSVYRVPFSQDRQRFATLLAEALAVVRAEPDFPDDLEWRCIALSSFSAGFGAVREILGSPGDFERIAGLCMVDSLYCGYVGEGTKAVQEGVVDPTLMKDFLRFARAAAAGQKVMIVSHCCLPTPGYASTEETADYLLHGLGLTARSVDTELRTSSGSSTEPHTLRLDRQANCGNFLLFGSPGKAGTDHIAHLRLMPFWLSKLPLQRRK